MILSNIKDLLVCLFIFSLFTTPIFSNNLEEDIADQEKTRDKIKTTCLNLKNNKFKDISSIPAKLVSIYYNGLLDFILDNNKDILSQYNKKASDFCIQPMEENYETKGFQSSGEGLIELGIGLNFLLKQALVIDNDADNISLISHEIAHNLLDHSSKRQSILKNIYKEYLSKQSKLSFDTYYKQHPDYIKESRLHEIEADNLGLNLYLNTKVKTTNFRIIFTKMAEINFSEEKPINISDDRWNFFKELSHSQTCAAKGIKILEKEIANKLSPKEVVQSISFNTFLDSIQYVSSMDIYPTGCWRFWNAYKQEILTNIPKDYSINTVNISYLNLDLSSYVFLSFTKNIESFKKDNISSESDPRFITIMSLFHPGSKINYSADISNDKKDIGVINEDNSLVLRYSDIIRIILILNTLEKVPCTSKMGISAKEAANILQHRLYKEIKNTFGN